MLLSRGQNCPTRMRFIVSRFDAKQNGDTVDGFPSWITDNFDCHKQQVPVLTECYWQDHHQRCERLYYYERPYRAGHISGFDVIRFADTQRD